MTQELIITIGKNAIETTILISAPVLVLSLIVGLIISIFQAATQINEATLTFVPKIVVTFVALLLFLPWMIKIMLSFTSSLLTNIPLYIR